MADAVPELTAVVVGSPKSNGDANTTAPQGEQVGDVLIVQAANHLQSVAVLDLYVREPLVPGRIVKFADATGLELARKREDLARRIDELHVEDRRVGARPSVAPQTWRRAGRSSPPWKRSATRWTPSRRRPRAASFVTPSRRCATRSVRTRHRG